MTTDFRREWIKQKVIAYFGLKSDTYFDEMLASNDELEDQFIAFIEEDFDHAEGSLKRFFYLYQTKYERLVEEEIMVPETLSLLRLNETDETTAVERTISKGYVEEDQSETPSRLANSPDGLEFIASASGGTGADTEKSETQEEILGKDEITQDEARKSPKSKKKKPKKGKKTGKKGTPRKGKKGKKHKIKPEDVEVVMDEQPPPEIIYVPKIIQKSVMETCLNGGFGLISEAIINHDNKRFIYFFRKTEEGIPNYETLEEANVKMPLHFLIGSCSGDMLNSLSNRIIEIYSKLLQSCFVEPVLKPVHSTEISIKKYLSEKEFGSYGRSSTSISTQKFNLDNMRVRLTKLLTNATAMNTKFVELSETPIKDELEKDLNTFRQSIEWILIHIDDDIDLPMMDLPDILHTNLTNDELIQDKELIRKLEEMAVNWVKHIYKVVENYSIKTPERDGPLSEYRYWREREVILRSIVEQLRKPIVEKILELLEIAKSPYIDSFLRYQSDLNQQYILAKETVRFLSTILRHLKIIHDYDDFIRIKDCIPLLMEGLQMIWVLSRYYCKDETIVPLMEQIIHCILEKVRKRLSTDTLFRRSINYIRTTIISAKEMLEMWDNSYKNQRRKIEESSKGARWEFDRKRLFAQSNYMVTVCNDLLEIVLIIEQYQQIFGPDLKSIVNNPQEIDNVNKYIEKLIVQIENVDFDIFSENCRENWQAMMAIFYKEVNDLDLQGCKFIDQIFNNFIRSDRSVRMLLKLKNLNTRPVILQRLLYKFDTVFDQLNKEILATEDIFINNMNNPPLCRNHPSFIGSIYWAHLLLISLKESVLLFEDIPELKNSKRKKDCFRKYYELGEKIKKYTNTKYEIFLKYYEPKIENLEKTTLLKLDTTTSIKKLSETKQKPTTTKSDNSAARSVQSLRKPSSSKLSVKNKLTILSKIQQQQQQSKTQLTWQDIVGDQLLIENNLQFSINFNNDIFNCICGAELLHQLNYEFGKNLIFITLRKEQLQKDVYRVREMIQNYNDFLEKLTAPQIDLLRNQIRDIELDLQQGLTCIYWLSLDIQKYCKKCSIKINYLKTIYNQINHLEQEIIYKKIQQLGDFNFFNYENNGQILDCKNYFQQIDQQRIKSINEMQTIYDTISKTLIKIETLILNTNTGRADLMKLTYQYWENEIYKTLTKFITKNLNYLLLKLKSTQPLFQLDTILLKPDIYLSPTIIDIFNIMKKSIEEFSYCLKNFMRWMDGSCLPCPNDSKFTFYTDIIYNRDISELIEQIQETIQISLLNTQRHLQRYKRYRNLWMFDKLETCREYLQIYQNDLIKFDEKFLFYTNIINDINQTNDYIDIDCLRLNLKSLLNMIKQQTIDWKITLGQLLDKLTKESMDNMKLMIEKLTVQLNLPVNNIDDFRIVTETIRRISTDNIEVELKYKHYQQTYLLLKQHELDYNLNHEQFANLLETIWCNLLSLSINRYIKLTPIREKYCNITVEEIEEFLAILDKFINKYDTEGPGSVIDDLEKGQLVVDEYQFEFQQLEQQRDKFIKLEYLFNLPTVDYSDYLNCKTNYEYLQILFKFYKKFKQTKEIWGRTLWSDLNTEILMKNIEISIKDFNKLPEHIRELTIGCAINVKLEQFKQTIPLMLLLKNPALRQRHWLKLMKLTKIHFDYRIFELNKIFQMHLYKYEYEVDDIVNYAINELIIEENLQKIINKWTNLNFIITNHKDYYILDEIEEFLKILDDDLINLNNMSTSKYVEPFYQQIKIWQKLLINANEIIEELLSLQTRWINFENLFNNNDDLQNELNEEFQLFNNINQEFCRIIDKIRVNPNILNYCKQIGILGELHDLQNQFDNCRKSLNHYLEMKRQTFPRFYFISDDELFTIICNNDNFEIIQQIIIKLFSNIKTLRLDVDIGMMTGLISSENEILEFISPVKFTNKFDEWLNDVVKEMLKTVRFLIKRVIFDYGKIYYKTRLEYLFKYPTIICLTNNLIWWTLEVEYVLQQNDLMSKYLKQLNQQLDDIMLVLNRKSTNQDYLKLQQILIVDLHQRDITENLLNLQNLNDFEWLKQLRCYWSNDSDNLLIKQLITTIDYGYEFMGLNNCFVITPLTDRLFLSITQTLMLNLNCLFMGRNNSGKTETIKNLATIVGKFCLIINCYKNCDYTIIGRYLTGIIQSGIWGCFKQFNQIEITTLSVISTQLQTIRINLVGKFDNNEICLNNKFGIFLTMNDNNFQLPETIKSLCRPIVCLQADLEQICFIRLYSCGFKQSKILTKKLINFYQLAKKLLTQQQIHYDWNLLSLNTILIQINKIKQSSLIKDETKILIKSLIDINLPKLINDDLTIFYNLIQNLFPGVDYHNLKNNFKNLQRTIEEILKNNKYLILQKQIDKILQLNELITIKYGLMLVGPTGGGKSVIINTLIKTQIKLGLTIKNYYINPKALTIDDFNCLLPKLLREINETNNIERFFINFDGDIDVLLLEQLNTLLNDNYRFLTLIDGERLYLNKIVYLLFEIGNLIHISPGILAKITMIYVDSKNFDYESYWICWLNNNLDNSKQRQYFEEFYQRFIPKLFNNGSLLKTIIPLNYLNLIKQFCQILDVININDKEIDNDLLLPIFIDCLYKSIGSLLIDDNRQQFDDFIKQQSQLTNYNDTIDNKCNPYHLPTTYPTLFDYYFDKNEQFWFAYDWELTKFVYDNRKFSQIFIPTIQTIRINKLLQLLIDHRPICLIGDHASSKTVIVENFLKMLNFDRYHLLNIQFSSSTTSKHVQKQLELNLEKLTKTIYGPLDGKKMICFIDDLNTPNFDDYGTQQPIALLKLLFEHNGYYDCNYNWRTIRDINYITAMINTQIDERFLSKLTIINVIPPDTSTLFYIYQTILEGYLSHFQPQLQIADKLIELTLNVYNFIKQQLPPSPSRFYYIFNIRDLSRIIGGLFQIKSEFYTKICQIIRVWRNEFTRVICDRLHNKDRDLLSEQIRKQIEIVFEIDDEDEDNIVEYSMRDPLLFGDYRNALSSSSSSRYYEDLLDYDAVYFLFQEILDDYNKKNVDKLNIILFNDFLEYLTRIHRCIRLINGHILLIGSNCCGKTVLTRLVTFTANYQLFTIKIDKDFDEDRFKNDLKQLYQQCGLEDKSTVFYCKTTQICDEFLEYLGNIVKFGVISNLFDNTDKETIIDKYRQNFGVDETITNREIWLNFLQKCRDNLHVIVATNFDDYLLNKIRKFPNLVNCTTVNLIESWSVQALYDIATVTLKDKPLIDEYLRDSIVEHVVHVHCSLEDYCRDYYENFQHYPYITCKHYLDLLEIYLKLLDEKNHLIDMNYQRLNDGLQKINDINLELENFNNLLMKQQKILKAAIDNCELMLQQIDISKKEAEEKKIIVSQKTIEIEEKLALINLEQIEAEKILKLALPKLEQARLALNDLNKLDITEIRSFPTPPEPVKILVECIALLFGYKEVNWKVAKGMMADPFFLKSLQDIDCNLITNEQQRTVKAHLKLTKQMDKMKQISKAGDNLLKYLYAILEYCEILRDIKPKQQRVEQLQAELNAIKQYLDKLNADIVKIEQLLIQYNQQYHESIQTRERLQKEIDLMLERFNIANKLINDLKIEKQHWTLELQQLQMKKQHLTGNCLLIASFFNYCGPFNYDYRQKIINNYQDDIEEKSIPITIPFNLITHLIDDNDVNYRNFDELSQQNSILLTKRYKIPLCIDPQQQAYNLIKTIEKSNDLMILNFNDSDFLKSLQFAIINGYPVLIDNINDDVDPIIDNILQNNYKIIDNKCVILFNGNNIDLNENFRLYLTTRLNKPQLKPTIYTNCFVINYTITINSLDEQLLDIVVSNERSDIEEQYQKTINEIDDNKNSLNNLKDLLLTKLTTVIDNLLDNLELIEMLENIKSQIKDTTNRIKSSEEILANLRHLRENYRQVSRRGAILFFILIDLSNINGMYQYSLTRYLEIFHNSLRRTLPFAVLTKRLKNINNLLMKNFYEYGCIGLYSQHKLFFSFLITIKLQLDSNDLKQSQLDFLINGSVNLEELAGCPDFLTKQNWNDIKKLSVEFPETFSNLLQDLKNNLDDWQIRHASHKPELLSPCEYHQHLKPFEILMLLRCFRIDRIYLGVNNYIQQILGGEFVQSPFINFDNIYKQSNCFVPILFILNSSDDPTIDLMKLSQTYKRKFHYLSLGQNQEIAALNLLETALTDGHWLLLQNCHLLTNFVKILERQLEKFETPHPDFRLWLTTRFTKRLPIGLLQNCMKIVVEPPNNFRLNLKNTYTRMMPELLDSCQHGYFKQLLFVLVFFNGVVQERRKFNKIGWNVFYDFNESDFNICVKLLDVCLTKNLEINDTTLPWNNLKCLIGDVIYGGRVSDDFDRRILATYIDEYMGDFLFSEFQQFHFYQDSLLDYVIPPDGNKDDYIAFIDGLPSDNGPEVYGLHSNAEIEYYTQSTKEMWQLLQLHTPITDVEENREDSVKTIANDILQKIPQQYDICEIREFYQHAMTPTVIVLLQELRCFNKLIETMQQTLTQLLKALNGVILMDTDLNDTANSLYNGHLPNSWRKVAPDTCKNLGSWLEHFEKRQEQYHTWATNDEPIVLWISGLHYPETYLKALVQLACRLQDWPLDKSTFTTVVSEFVDPEEVTMKPSEGNCMIYGLYLEGAGWDLQNQCLRRSSPRVLNEKMPVIEVIPIENFRLKLQNTFRTPVYTTSQRCNVKGEGLAFEVNLNTDKHSSHWILQGVCLILNAD